jgi:hypothetical protein
VTAGSSPGKDNTDLLLSFHKNALLVELFGNISFPNSNPRQLHFCKALPEKMPDQ